MRKEVDNMARFRISATEEEISEFYCLVEDCKELGITTSSQLTKYIRRYKVGYKYKHIAGELYLSDGYDQWTCPGGISPEYYGKLCRELSLDYGPSRARVEGFCPYAEMDLFDWNAA